MSRALSLSKGENVNGSAPPIPTSPIGSAKQSRPSSTPWVSTSRDVSDVLQHSCEMVHRDVMESTVALCLFIVIKLLLVTLTNGSCASTLHGNGECATT